MSAGTVVKNLPANAGDTGDTDSVPRSGRSPGGGHGNSLQYSCQENPMDRNLVGYSPQGPCGRKESYTTEQQNTHTPPWTSTLLGRRGNKMLPKEQEKSRISDLTSITHTPPKSQLLYTMRIKKKVTSQFSLPEIPEF